MAVGDDAVIGWAAASPVSDRCCYSGVVENSVYVDPAHQAKGLGKQVLGALIEASELAGTWTIQTGIFAENTAVQPMEAPALLPHDHPTRDAPRYCRDQPSTCCDV